MIGSASVKVFFFSSCCKLIILIKNKFVSPEDKKTMPAILWIICCHKCTDNSSGRTENWWRETQNYLKWMVSRYLNPRPLHAASSEDLSSSPRLPDTVSPLYKSLRNSGCCIASVLNARPSARLLQYAEHGIYHLHTAETEWGVCNV